MTVIFEDLSPSRFRSLLPQSLGIYTEAMNYPPTIARARATAWMQHSLRLDWSAVGAFELPLRDDRRWSISHAIPEVLVGICYGYRGAEGQWWNTQVSAELNNRGEKMPQNYVELTEVHVSPLRQGQGIGRGLLDVFLSSRTEPEVLLSTPEADEHTSPAWRLYRSTGFCDLLRDFNFAGDDRPFAVLTHSLPWSAIAATATEKAAR